MIYTADKPIWVNALSLVHKCAQHTHTKKLNPTHFQECLEFRNMSYILKSCWGVSPWTTSVGDELAEAKNKHNGTEVQSFFSLIYNLQTEHEEKLILDIRPDNSCNFV